VFKQLVTKHDMMCFLETNWLLQKAHRGLLISAHSCREVKCSKKGAVIWGDARGLQVTLCKFSQFRYHCQVIIFKLQLDPLG